MIRRTTVDKVPPHVTEAELSVIGTCLSYPHVAGELSIKPEMFYNEKYQKIFNAIIEVSKTGVSDIISVCDYLSKKNELEMIGGAYFVTKLTENIFSDQMVQRHALMIKEKYLLREYIRLGYDITGKAFEQDLNDVAEFAESALFALSDFTHTKEPTTIANCVDELLVEIEKVYTKEKSLVGVPSGFTSIDRITGGWQPGNLIIIAGRPSMGKTALALQLALNPARLNYPVCIFSLEMSKEELTTRMLSSVTEYTNVEIRNADINFETLVQRSNDIALLPIIIDDTAGLGLFELRSKVKKLILRNGIKLIIVDYLQLMSAEAGNREQEISKISRGLKGISKEFGIPVIALSQLNRGVEERADKRPRLSDLRESGAIEQDSDIVCFIYRPAYYNITAVKIDKDDINTDGVMIIDGSKNRNGALFSKVLYHNSSLTKIQEEKFEIKNEPY